MVQSGRGTIGDEVVSFSQSIYMLILPEMQFCAFASPFIYIWLPYVGLQTTPRGSRMLPLHLWSYQEQDRIVMMLLRLRYSSSNTLILIFWFL